MAAEEEDIELTEEEIAATRLALMIICGLLEDFLDRDNTTEEEFNRWQETCKEMVGLGPDCSLSGLLLSALEKFGEEETNYGDHNQEADQD